MAEVRWTGNSISNGSGGGGGSGDVVGPASSTDNAIARYDGTTGKLIQNSLALVDDSGNVFATRYSPLAGNNFLGCSSSGNALTTGIQNIFIGNSAGAAYTTTNNIVMIGHQAGITTTGASNVGIGGFVRLGTTASLSVVIGAAAGSTVATGARNVIIGHLSGNLTSSAQENVIVGQNAAAALTTGSNNIIIGRGAGPLVTTGSFNLLLGQFADPSSPTASNEVVFGSNTAPFNTMYFGRGVTSGGQNAYTIAVTSATGANVNATTNKLTIQGSRSTGTGTGGSIAFSTSPAGASGSTLNTVVEAGSVDANGKWVIGATSSTQEHVINGSGSVLTAAAGTAFNISKSENTGLVRLLGGQGVSSAYIELHGATSATPEQITLSNNTGNVFHSNQAGTITLGIAGTIETHRLNTVSEAAAADILTMTNGPTGTAGDPDIYLRLNVNGTVYVFPGWAV